MAQFGSDAAPQPSLCILSVTARVIDALTFDEINFALYRHRIGDWGEVESADRELNEQALATGGRLVSLYCTRSGHRFYVITDAGWTMTSILLSSES